jgi:uncharacterized phage protein gp47/JayE
MTTNVPAITWTPQGLDIPEESAVLAGTQADINDAFGGTLNPALDTPQGQLATSLTAIIADKNAQVAEVVNQINPDTASGKWQDAIARIYFLDRSPGAPTTVQCVCSGSLGTTIPVGALAQDTNGNRYRCTQAGTIGVSGNITLPFANETDGPVPCPAGTLTQIYQAVPGWDSINNPSDGALGQNIESQEAFAYRRQQSVALNAQHSLQSIYANVFDLDDVLDVCARENVTGAPVAMGSTGYVLAEHSLYVAVLGGDAEEIANAIWVKKSLGCDYNGNTTVVVTDQSGYDPPYPTYEVKFHRPTPLPILFQVSIQADPNLPADIVPLTKAAIIAAFNGQAPQSTRVRIGSLLLASRFYRYVQAIGTEVSVLQILIGTSTANLNSLLVGIDQAPTIDESDIAVVLVP